MQQAFQVVLQPSLRGRILTIVLHLAALAVCVGAFYGWMRWMGLPLLAASFAWAWHTQTLRGADAVHKIAVNRQGQAALFVGQTQTAFSAKLMLGSMTTRQILFLQWDIGDRIIRHCILPDMTDHESYRRLLVWARWGQVKD